MQPARQTTYGCFVRNFSRERAALCTQEQKQQQQDALYTPVPLSHTS
jgi:hypothetical protein